MGDLSPLAETFKLRCKRVWDLVVDDKLGEAFEAAAALLLEPSLDLLYQASMHIILAFSHKDDCAEHALEVVRLYTEMGARNDLTDWDRQEIAGLLSHANRILDKARELKAEYDRRVKEILTSRMEMDQLHEAQIEEMHKRLDAKEVTAEAEAAQNDDGDDDDTEIQDVPDTQDVPGVTDDSQSTGADSQRTETGYLSDNDPMPDIVRLQL